MLPGAAGQVGSESRRSAASTSPGESWAIRRICRFRDHPLVAHDHGNSCSGSRSRLSATPRRNSQISAFAGSHCVLAVVCRASAHRPAFFPPSPAVFRPVACRVSPVICCRAVLQPIARPFSAVACRVFPPSRAVFPPSPAVFLPFACRVSARRLPFLCPSPAVFPPSPAVACRASTHRPAFLRRRLPCFCPSPAMFPPLPAVACRASTHRPDFPAVACHVSARCLPCFPHRLPSRAALPPIARLLSRRRLHCFIIKTKNCVCARNCHSECESVSRVQVQQ